MGWIAKWLRRVLFSDEETPQGVTTNEASLSEKTTPVPRLGSSRYEMTYDEFRNIIPPLLLQYPFCAIGFTDDHVKLIWQSTSSNSSEAYQAKDALRWSHNDATLNVAGQLRFNYERLRRAKEDGCAKVNIDAQEGCYCMDGVAERFAPIDEMLAAFEGQKSSAPIIPPPELPCCFDQDVQSPCRCGISGIVEWTLGEVVAPSRDAHPLEHTGHDILKGLKAFVERNPAAEPLPVTWRSIFIENTAKRIGARLKARIADRQMLVAKLEMIYSAGVTSTIENPADELSLAFHMKDLRAMQKKYGLRGHRTKVDVASQIMGHEPARSETNEIFANRLRNSVASADSDIESLTAQMRDIWERLNSESRQKKWQKDD